MINKPKNLNYCATVVEIKNKRELSNCDNLVATTIFNSSVIIGKDTKIGTKGLFFPLETQLSEEFLSNNNLYRKSELNKDVTKKGYFEETGRIRAVKLRGNKSEGLLYPLNCLDYLGNIENLAIGDEFDELNNRNICKKYIAKQYAASNNSNSRKSKKAVVVSKLVDNQFRFHYDTAQLKKNIDRIDPFNFISISEKFHGTSFVVSNILTKRKLNWMELLLKRFNINISETIYDSIFASRKVIKNENMNSSESFYSFDIWKDINDRIRYKIPKGFIIYGEAVGYLPTGKMIQPGYHYGAELNNYDIYIYRVTQTNQDGYVTELSWQQMKEFCEINELNTVKELYYGRAIDLYPKIKNLNITEWANAFLEKLIKDENLYMNDVMCRHNNFKVPSEGIVIRVDGLRQSEAYKLKNFKFLEWETKELDKGEVDIESSQDVVKEQIND